MSKLRVLEQTYDGRKIFYDAKGYACVWIDGKTKKVHVLEWEKHNGPKPDGHDIHHLDENKSNFSAENLELLTHSDHQRVHAGWVRQDGAWAAKPCTACGQVLPLGSFYPRKGLAPTAKCRPCHNASTDAWVNNNRGKRRKIALDYYYRSKAHV